MRGHYADGARASIARTIQIGDIMWLVLDFGGYKNLVNMNDVRRITPVPGVGCNLIYTDGTVETVQDHFQDVFMWLTRPDAE